MSRVSSIPGEQESPSCESVVTEKERNKRDSGRDAEESILADLNEPTGSYGPTFSKARRGFRTREKLDY